MSRRAILSSFKTKMSMLALMMLLVVVLGFFHTSQIPPKNVPHAHAQLYIGTTNSVVKGPSQMIFHGILEAHQVDERPNQHPVIAHVLLKAKRLVSGSLMLRAVCFTERVSLQSRCKHP